MKEFSVFSQELALAKNRKLKTVSVDSVEAAVEGDELAVRVVVGAVLDGALDGVETF